VEYDLIVVGSGSVGAAAGYYATKAGLKVLMIDSHKPPHSEGSHHGDTRIIRHAYGEGAKYVPLALRAQALWNQLEEEKQVKLFHACGVLNIAPFGSEFIENVKISTQNYGLNTQELSAAQISEKWPEITVSEGYSGIYEPEAGFLRSELAVATYLKSIEEQGSGIIFNCPVTAIEPYAEGVEVTTIEGRYQGRKVLVSAGTWVKKLLPDLPITPMRKVFSWHQADGRYSEGNKFPAFTISTLDQNHYYGFPADDNGLKVGKHNGGQPIDGPEQRKPFGKELEDGTEVFNFMREFLPGVGVCLNGKACSYDVSPDEDFIIDTLPESQRVMVITGLSGHGFKFASAFGELVTEFAQDKPLSIDISAFSLSRF